MSNILLYINNKKADIDSNQSIFLDKSFINGESEFSYSINLPSSDNNQEIFGYASVFDVPKKFSRRYQCTLSVDEILVMEGYFVLSSIEKNYYVGNIIVPVRSDIKDLFGDLKMNEIYPHYKLMTDFQRYTQQNDSLNGFSTDMPTKYVDNHICYPYILYSKPYNTYDEYIIDENDKQKLSLNENNFSYQNVIPAFNLLSVVKDIFKTKGYDVIGNVFSNSAFDKMYQTLNISGDDYNKLRNVPYYLDFDCSYSNWRNSHIPETLRISTLWEEQSPTTKWNGEFKYGSDTPLGAGNYNTQITINDNASNMLIRGEETNGYVIRIPKTGWYRINLQGTMKYPDKSGSKIEIKTVSGDPVSRVIVCGTQNRADKTDLSEQPFEIQLKKYRDYVDPNLYSFCSFIPNVPRFYHNGDVQFVGNDTLLKPSSERVMRYPKNGDVMMVNEYSNTDAEDLICGARLGGAFFSGQWPQAGKGNLQRPNRFSRKAAGLALPKTTNTTIQEYEEEDYLVLGRKNNNKTYEYSENTAFVMTKPQNYTNRKAYNTYNEETNSWTIGAGETTYNGLDSCSASTTDSWNGSYKISTIAYLTEGDLLDIQVMIPYNSWQEYSHSNLFKHSYWKRLTDCVNITDVDFNLKIGFINDNKDWLPNGDDISWDYLKQEKECNVNSMLGIDKAQNFVDNFLKTFNLRLSMVDKKTFSIDFKDLTELRTNIVDLNEYANANFANYEGEDAVYIKSYTFNGNTSEIGYQNSSGYTGEFSITNEQVPFGKIENNKTNYSYAWYTPITFDGASGLTPNNADVMVITKAETWNQGFQKNPRYDTNSTSRLFFLTKGENGLIPSIEFAYSKNKANGKLLLPSNNIGDFEIDYNYICPKYFDIKENKEKWKVVVECTLPNRIFSSITSGTLIKFNGNIFKCLEISGHDVGERQDSEITLENIY